PTTEVTTAMTESALRHALQTVVMEAALRLHYEQYPGAKPTPMPTLERLCAASHPRRSWSSRATPPTSLQCARPPR
ncbi:MAG TPA: hypothetical protein VL068_00225, partial [Microthrixaceae bacterium]|nr:hypothetical protein [Microthrixaceae bacterium]